MKTISVIFIMCLAFCGCNQKQDLSLSHKISIPLKFLDIGQAPEYKTGNAGKYLNAYANGWWSCIDAYHKNINYKFIKSDSYWNGNSASVSGGGQGYTNANQHMQDLIAKYGRKKVEQFLKTTYGPKL